jgi:hypothetical protein
MRTNNINEIEITEGHTKGFFFTKWSLFLKEGGVRHHIDQVQKDVNGNVTSLCTRNSKTGKTDVRTISGLSSSSFFTNN